MIKIWWVVTVHCVHVNNFHLQLDRIRLNQLEVSNWHPMKNYRPKTLQSLAYFTGEKRFLQLPTKHFFQCQWSG